MKPSPMLLLAFAALAALAPAAAAQPCPQTRPIIPAPATHNGSITTETDGEGDGVRRIVTLQPMDLPGTATQQASFSLTYSYTTNPFTPDGGVRLILLSRGPQCRFAPNTRLALTLGNGVPLGIEHRPTSGFGVNWVYSEVDENGVCAESLTATLHPKTFERIATTRLCTVGLDSATFKFGTNHTNAIRAFQGVISRAPN